MLKFLCKLLALALLAMLATGCASNAPTQDYTAYKASKPRSILVLPPVSESLDVNAGFGVLSQVTYPLAEAGYYVLPVSLVSETFKQNGMTTANDIQSVSPAKLRTIFGADAVLYLDVHEYGVHYQVFDSVARVAVSAKLVDLRSGTALWSGSAVASSAENQNNNNLGLVGMLIQAAIKQVVNNVSDASYPVAGVASQRLLSVGANGLLYGPYSPHYGTD
jgi:hypothetical protein